MKSITVKNNQSLPLKSIPQLDYPEFAAFISESLTHPACHCVNYFAVPENKNIILYVVIADDASAEIHVSSCKIEAGATLASLTPTFPGIHVYEREMAECFDIHFSGNNWDKPIRYPHDRIKSASQIGDYPFYSIDSAELHEVGVGPIHAGVIEPGHFRFLCNGEKVLHLEIQLGYQHRGVEKMMRDHSSLIYQTKMAESIAGDTVIGNNLTFAQNIESLSNFTQPHNVQIERAIALELERIAIHTGDLSALCTDVAYQLGSTVLQGLRTIIINSFLTWSGNRFGRNLIFPLKNPFPLTSEKKATILAVLNKYEKQFNEVADLIFDLPSVLARFEKTGVVTPEQAAMMHFTGMAARSSGIMRDIRKTHPTSAFTKYAIPTQTLDSGDVMARAMLRRLEINTSLNFIRELMSEHQEESTQTGVANLQPSAMVVTLNEGWRGEICHAAITNAEGKISWYKIKDPSLHNWFALALAVRKNDISDFPVCNKSFNLSYCGHDL